jgi:hypothetical protein
MYGLGVGISTVFEILGHFLFKGDRTTPYGHDLYTIRWSLTQGTRIYMVWGDVLNNVQDIQQFPVSGGWVDPRGHT